MTLRELHRKKMKRKKKRRRIQNQTYATSAMNVKRMDVCDVLYRVTVVDTCTVTSVTGKDVNTVEKLYVVIFVLITYHNILSSAKFPVVINMCTPCSVWSVRQVTAGRDLMHESVVGTLPRRRKH